MECGKRNAVIPIRELDKIWNFPENKITLMQASSAGQKLDESMKRTRSAWLESLIEADCLFAVFGKK